MICSSLALENDVEAFRKCAKVLIQIKAFNLRLVVV